MDQKLVSLVMAYEACSNILLASGLSTIQSARWKRVREELEKQIDEQLGLAPKKSKAKKATKKVVKKSTTRKPRTKKENKENGTTGQ